MSEATTPAPSRNERIQEAIKAVVKDENERLTPKPEGEKPEVKPAEVKPEAPKGEDRSFEKLLKEKAALRREKESQKPIEEASKHFDPGTLLAIARAKANGDPMAAMAAMGFSYTDIAKRAAGVKPDAKPEEAEEAPAVKALRDEVTTLKQDLAQRRAKEEQATIVNRIKELVTEDKFSHVSKLEEHAAVLRYLENFHAQTGSFPAETFEENIEIAAAAVERDLTAQAKRWERVLTKSEAPVTVPGEGHREPPSVGQGSTGKTLTNSQSTAPKAATPEPKSREELLKQLAADTTIW